MHEGSMSRFAPMSYQPVEAGRQQHQLWLPLHFKLSAAEAPA